MMLDPCVLLTLGRQSPWQAGLLVAAIMAELHLLIYEMQQVLFKSSFVMKL
jgi:hypothetical protein